MASKKDIGNFFKENLNELDIMPSNIVWESIEKDLIEKKKKKRVFLWFLFASFLGGALSTFIILNFLPVDSMKNLEKINNEVNSNLPSLDSKDSFNDSSKSEIVTIDSINSRKDAEVKVNRNIEAAKAKKMQSKKDILSKNKQSKSKTKNQFLAATKTSEGRIKSDINSNTNQTEDLDNPSIDNEETNLNTLKSSVKKNDNEFILKDLDSISKGKKGKNEKTLKEAEKDSLSKAIQKDKHLEMIIAPYYGLSYSGKMGKNNSISNQYDILDEGGELNQNFGILFRWMVSENIGIQTGIGVLQSNRFLEVIKNDRFFNYNMNLDLINPLENYTNLLQHDDKVKFQIENSFIEIPLEAYYIWSNKQFGLATSFGFSVLFLNKNDVYLSSSDVEKFRIGSSLNASSQSFSANGKINLFYKLTNRVQLDIYPEFQYQIMSHKNISNIHPFYFSLKAGVSFHL